MPLSTLDNLPNIDVAPFRQVEIPVTSKERYISGLHALNIPAPEGTFGDWHDVFHHPEDAPDRAWKLQLGGSDWVDTNHIYQDLGVYQGLDNILHKGLQVPDDMTEVWVANHFRAILDLIYRSLQRFDDIYGLEAATTDWLDTPEQQTYLLEQATLMLPHLSHEHQEKLAAWIEQEAQRT